MFYINELRNLNESSVVKCLKDADLIQFTVNLSRLESVEDFYRKINTVT